MKVLLFLLVVSMSVLFTTAFRLNQNNAGDRTSALHLNDEEEASSLRGANWFFDRYQWRKNRLSCNKFPRMCRSKMSPGPDCCRGRCVNVMTDRFNCEMCGNTCRYSQLCCRGKCVNPWFDKSNCGGCNNKCIKGEFCAYGMCNYA